MSELENVTEQVSNETPINKPEAEKPKARFYANAYDLVSIVMTSFIIIALVFTFAVRLVGVVGHSMENTVSEGDWLLTYQKTTYDYGDIVVITQPNYFDEPLIKRVIAKAGQTVNIDYATSTVYVDDVALSEPYTKDTFILQNSDDISFPYTVPEGCLFCMGDNRNGSTDCRSTLIGPINEQYILGKAFIRILPFGDFNIYE